MRFVAPRLGPQMAAATESKAITTSEESGVPKHPGPNAQQHVVLRYLEQLEDTLSKRKLLTTAHRGAYAPAEAIVDTDVASVSRLPGPKRLEMTLRIENQIPDSRLIEAPASPGCSR